MPMGGQAQRNNRVAVAELFAAAFVAASLAFTASASPAWAEESNLTNVNILVKEADTGEPIENAQITLRFKENPGKLKRARTISMTAKTNAQGKCKVPLVPKGTIKLLVTAERRQSFGREFEIEEDDPLIEITLRRPQPLL
jgi:hypothetical protein